MTRSTPTSEHKRKARKKIAIFHDYFGSIGGGEKLVLELAKGLNADIITTDFNKKNFDKLGYKGVKVRTLGNCIQYPGIKQLHTSLKFYLSNFKEYDIYIMSGNWTVFAAHNHRPNTYYIHTPVRMFYDSYKNFRKIASWPKKLPFMIWVWIHKYLLEKQFVFVDNILTNSINVQKRIRKYHKRNSTVVYPPIKNYPFIKYGDYWISVNRIYPHKRIDLQIDVFRSLPNERLIIVGGYAKGDHAVGYAKKIFKNLPSNITYLGVVSEKKLEELYGSCKAFITTSQNEDFGMTVLEAMSASKPVVAVNEGGYKESVINGHQGYLVKADKLEIINAIKKVSKNPSKYASYCRSRAKLFSIKKFVDKVKNNIY